MELFGIEKLSLVDYDGKIATTVFTGSCNFRCGFCHNATLVVDYKDLPTLSEQEVFDYINKRKGVLEGVCVTGGEPTLQKDLPEFCEKLKNTGLSVKLDTNGTNPSMVKSLVENGLVDYFAMDIKNDKENYAKIIGFDNYDTKKVEETVDFFLSGKTDFEFRTTLIREYHKEENVKAISEWIKGTDKYFLQKFKNGDNCLTNVLHEIDVDTVKRYLEIIGKNIPNVKTRGYDL